MENKYSYFKQKIHIDLYQDEHEYTIGCNVDVFADIKTTSDWNKVTCQRCLGRREKIEKEFEETQKRISEGASFEELCERENQRRKD